MAASADDVVTTTFEMELKPDFIDSMIAGFAQSLEETRAFPGCRRVHAYQSHHAPNRLILLEEWDSKKAYEKYLAWRKEGGMLDAMAQAFEGPSRPKFWTLVA